MDIQIWNVISGKPRQTIVKLKCLEGNSGAVSLYLLEPKYCEYVLGVESPLICDILDKSDENGLVPAEIMDQITQGESPVKDNKEDGESDETNNIITS